MNKQTNKYIEEASEEQKKIMLAIRAIIHQQVPDVIENFKWGRPVFSNPSDFAYFKTTKSYLAFGFFKFDKINDETHLLEGNGKEMRHIKYRKIEDLQPHLLKSWIDSFAR